MNKDKNFDAAVMMREIRENLSDKYWKHPEVLKSDMQAIKAKYNSKITNSGLIKASDNVI